MIRGEVKNVLNKPNTVELSKTMASKIFGDNDAVGEEIELVNNIGEILNGYEPKIPIEYDFCIRIHRVIEFLNYQKRKRNWH